MTDLRIAQISDLHLGDTGAYHWHNLELHGDATPLTEAAIGSVNRAAPDLVIVTGDLTNSATPDAFSLARSVLDRLTMPYYVLPGNHDVSPPGSWEIFTSTFADRLPDARGYGVVDVEGVRLFTLAHHWLSGRGETGIAVPPDEEQIVDAVIPGEEAAWLERELEADPGAPVLVFLHYPLVPMEPRFAGYSPKWAGDLRNREQVLELLLRFSQVRAVFCGHQHYNQISRVPRAGGDSLLHAMLCACVEYPMMWREITIASDIRVATHLTPAGALREKSFLGLEWPMGTDADREASIALRAGTLPK